MLSPLCRGGKRLAERFPETKAHAAQHHRKTLILSPFAKNEPQSAFMTFSPGRSVRAEVNCNHNAAVSGAFRDISYYWDDFPSHVTELSRA